ncbi:MAG: tRNA pseudouridine(55) synthase TruB [Clostridia bacterium]|nr:tRNA pseudouridine(55) synthase TruB [Clostridia bacterium]
MANQTNAPDGVLIINKHAGVTSHDIVGMTRRLFGTRAVGHAGTLDPMATGVLVVLIGRAAKASEYLTGEDKRYVARLRLGLTTDTEDTTGVTLTTSDALPAPDAVMSVMDHFRGNILQVPPMVSALKVGGQKLVDLARQGIEIERKARPVTIHSLLCEPTDTLSDYVLDVTCSGGTYIRTLCADIGAALGCGGAMAALDRRAACGFTIEQSVTVAELEQMSMDERLARLIPTEQLFARLASVTLTAFYDRLIGNGCAVALTKLRLSLPLGTRLRLCHTDGAFFALGEVVDSDEGLALKAIKTFVL